MVTQLDLVLVLNLVPSVAALSMSCLSGSLSLFSSCIFGLCDLHGSATDLPNC